MTRCSSSSKKLKRVKKRPELVQKQKLFVSYQGQTYQLGFVRSSPVQTVLDLGALGGGEHYTFHELEGKILSTHWSKKHPGSTWDDYRIEAARAVGFANPERHAKYLHHMPLQFDENDIYIIGARRIAIAQLKPKTPESDSNVVALDHEAFWLELNFSKARPDTKWPFAIESEFGWLLLGIGYNEMGVG